MTVHTAPTSNHRDHAKASSLMPVDVAIALDDGDMQVRHMLSSKMGYESGMVKLTIRQYEILRSEIHARYSGR